VASRWGPQKFIFLNLQGMLEAMVEVRVVTTTTVLRGKQPLIKKDNKFFLR